MQQYNAPQHHHSLHPRQVMPAVEQLLARSAVTLQPELPVQKQQQEHGEQSMVVVIRQQP
jgi:hypothetical protein